MAICFFIQGLTWACPELSVYSLRKQAYDETVRAKKFYNLTPGNSDEPFWHLVERAAEGLKAAEDKRHVQALLSKVALDNKNGNLAQSAIAQIAAIQKSDGSQIGVAISAGLVKDAQTIGDQASTDHVSNDNFWQFMYRSLETSDDELRQMTSDFLDEMQRGLCNEPSSLAMIPTYVGPPSGYEKGTFLALDVGGTNVRWLAVTLHGNGVITEVSDGGRKMPPEARGGTAGQLFGFIAGRGKAFIEAEGLQDQDPLNTGFTWSYPVIMTGVAEGAHLQFSKEVTATGVDGKNPVDLLSASFDTIGVDNVSIRALCNDTVGTFMTWAVMDPTCAMGVISGTGSNACYPEDIENIKKWTGKPTNSTLCGKMIINTEWGNFGSRKLANNKLVDEHEKTVRMDPFDVQLDIDSEKPGDHIYEKQIAGMYLGECVRLRCMGAIKRGLLFDGTGSLTFYNKGGFATDHLSLIVADGTNNLSEIENFLIQTGIHNSTLQDRIALKRICQDVVKRGARRNAVGVAAIIKKIDPKLERNHTVAIDGSLYEHHPYFRAHLGSAVLNILGPAAEGKIGFKLTKDGSGKGAAVTTAVVSAEYFNDGVQVNTNEWGRLTELDGTVTLRNLNDPGQYAQQMGNGLWVRETIPGMREIIVGPQNILKSSEFDRLLRELIQPVDLCEMLGSPDVQRTLQLAADGKIDQYQAETELVKIMNEGPFMKRLAARHRLLPEIIRTKIVSLMVETAARKAQLQASILASERARVGSYYQVSGLERYVIDCTVHRHMPTGDLSFAGVLEPLKNTLADIILGNNVSEQTISALISQGGSCIIPMVIEISAEVAIANQVEASFVNAAI